MMPLTTGPRCVTQPAPLAREPSFRALHHLSHGDPMPTAENAFQVPGYVSDPIFSSNKNALDIPCMVSALSV